MPNRKHKPTGRKIPFTTKAKVSLCRERELEAMERWRQLGMHTTWVRETFDRPRETRQRWERRWVDEVAADEGSAS